MRKYYRLDFYDLVDGCFSTLLKERLYKKFESIEKAKEFSILYAKNINCIPEVMVCV